jgi:hypothetical protein
MDNIIEIAKAGLNRFYDEGYIRWPEDKLRTLFCNRGLQEPEIASALEEWKAGGCIELPKQTNEYLKMLTIIP